MLRELECATSWLRRSLDEMRWEADGIMRENRGNFSITRGRLIVRHHRLDGYWSQSWELQPMGYFYLGETSDWCAMDSSNERWAICRGLSEITPIDCITVEIRRRRKKCKITL